MIFKQTKTRLHNFSGAVAKKKDLGNPVLAGEVICRRRSKMYVIRR